MEYNQVNIPVFEDLLQERSVSFLFLKVNGNMRSAVGTTNVSNIPTDKHPVSEDNRNGSINFYDISKGAWRAISRDSQIFVEVG